MPITTSNTFHLKKLEITTQVTAPAFAETEKRYQVNFPVRSCPRYYVYNYNKTRILIKTTYIKLQMMNSFLQSLTYKRKKFLARHHWHNKIFEHIQSMSVSFTLLTRNFLLSLLVVKSIPTFGCGGSQKMLDIQNAFPEMSLGCFQPPALWFWLPGFTVTLQRKSAKNQLLKISLMNQNPIRSNRKNILKKENTTSSFFFSSLFF